MPPAPEGEKQVLLNQGRPLAYVRAEMSAQRPWGPQELCDHPPPLPLPPPPGPGWVSAPITVSADRGAWWATGRGSQRGRHSRLQACTHRGEGASRITLPHEAPDRSLRAHLCLVHVTFIPSD